MLWWALSALASPLYPATLQAELELSCPPPCTVCHETAVGGTGTATRPFAVTLQELGLTGASATDTLQSALAQLEGSDEVQALQAGLDPNPGPNGGTEYCAVLTPTYGCFSHVPGTASSWPLGIAGFVLWLVRSRRGQR
jgi:hypothetical protein